MLEKFQVPPTGSPLNREPIIYRLYGYPWLRRNQGDADGILAGFTRAPCAPQHSWALDSSLLLVTFDARFVLYPLVVTKVTTMENHQFYILEKLRLKSK